MSNNQILVFDPKRRRNQSIETAMASISYMMGNLEKEEQAYPKFEEASAEDIEEDAIGQFTLPPNTIMTRQDTFGEIPHSSLMAGKQSNEEMSLASTSNWNRKSDDASLNDTYYSLDRNSSLYHNSIASIASLREAKRVSIRKSPMLKRSPDIDTLRKSYSCGNFRSYGQGMKTPTQEKYEGFPYKMTNVPTLNLARHTRDSSFSISSPETVLTSYFSDTEDIETPESPFFNIHEDAFSQKPTLRQIRNSFLDPGPSRENSANGFKIKPLTLTLSPITKSEAINKILRERKDSSSDHKDGNHTIDSAPMLYQHSEPINEAERLIQSYFADTNLMRQHLYNEYNASVQQSQPETDMRHNSGELFKSDAEVLLDISTGGWGGKYSTGEEVPPLLYHESSADYFREQMPIMKAEKMVENEFIETIDSDQTPTNEFATNKLATQSQSDEVTEQKNTRVAQKKKPQALQVQKKNKLAPPALPPKSPRRPQTIMRAASHSLDLAREPGLAEDVSIAQEKLLENRLCDNPVKSKDFVDDFGPEIKQPTVPIPIKPRLLRSSRSENALDRFYHSGQAYTKGEDPIAGYDRVSLTLSRLGFSSNTGLNANFPKFQHLYKPNQVESGSDDDIGFSTNVTPSSQRSSRLIRSVAAFKSLSKRFTRRKSQMIEFSQKSQVSKDALEKNTTMMNVPEPTDYSIRKLSPISPGNRFKHHPNKSDPPRNTTSSPANDADIERSRSLSPVQQVYTRAWSNKKAPKSPMVAANKTQNYF